jgi:very-short-patch-repair endonuclease
MAADPAIAALAARQHGVVSRAQLLAAGLSKAAIDHRLARQRLHPVHRGVYLVGHPVPPPLAKEMAAILACGEGAAVSHGSAAAIWGFRPPLSSPVHVTLPSPVSRTRLGICVHRARFMQPEDIRCREALLITAPARTLVDLAAVLSAKELQRAYEEARIHRVVRPSDLRSVLTRTGRKPGFAAMRALLDRERAPTLTRSEAERRLLELLRAADLAPNGANVRVGRHEVDFLWRDSRLVVEVDGFAYHAHRGAFERDRLRDAELQAAGYRVMRVTWRQIAEAPEAVIARVAQALVAVAA